jgi:hypothetical protein
VLARLSSDPKIGKMLKVGRVVIAAHSGGGLSLGAMLDEQQREELKPSATQDRSKMRLPSELRELILFDAINKDVATYLDWIDGQIRADIAMLKGLRYDPVRLAWLGKSLRVRAICSDAYRGNYQAFEERRAAALSKGDKTLSAEVMKSLRANYPPVEFTGLAAGEHDAMVGKSKGVVTSFEQLPPLP